MGAKIHISDSLTVPVVGTCTLGRQLGNHIQLTGEQTSRRHALIHIQNGNEYWLVDLGSRNGTYINGKRVQAPILLRDQDRIEIGGQALTFILPPGEAAGSGTGSDLDMTITSVKNQNCFLLLCDIKGFTAMSQQVGPDELAMKVGKWLADCKAFIEDNGGVINKYLGDGLFAFWRDEEGVLPNVVNAVNQLKYRQHQATPDFRIVTHHGSVTFGGISANGEESLLGPEVNYVFRMEKLAASLQSKCMLSQAVAKLWPGKSSLTPLGQHPVQGFKGMFSFYGY